MKPASIVACLLPGLGLCLSVHPARAQEGPVGLYVGAGVGTATLRQEAEPATGYYGVTQTDFGWNVFVGVRPLPLLGVEFGYLDFGSGNRHGYYPGIYLPSHASASAPAGFAVGYLPVLPWWDVYLKAGAADLHRRWDFSPQASCSPGMVCPAIAFKSYVGSTTEWDFAWGVGTQWSFGALALRLEYERATTNGTTHSFSGGPDLLSIGASWTLL